MPFGEFFSVGVFVSCCIVSGFEVCKPYYVRRYLSAGGYRIRQSRIIILEALSDESEWGNDQRGSCSAEPALETPQVAAYTGNLVSNPILSDVDIGLRYFFFLIFI